MNPATIAHADALSHLHAQAFPHGERWGAAAMGLQLSLPGAFGWISARGGMVLARVAADEAEILTLAVDSAARRQGLGRALMGRAMHTAAGRGAASMVLEVAEGNAGARALYAGLGFAEVGRRRGYYAGGMDALIMRAPVKDAGGPCGCAAG